MTWYALGGYRNPPTPLEIMAWTEAMRRDFATLLTEMERAKRREKWFADHKDARKK